MSEEENININVDAALFNAQKGDVLVLFVPEDFTEGRANYIAEQVQDIFAVNGIEMVVLVLPKTWTPMVIEEGQKEDYGIPDSMDDIIEGGEDETT